MNKIVNKQKFIQDFTNAVMDMRTNHSNGTYWWYLSTDENDNDWAIVLGWSDGFGEPNEIDDCVKENCRLCVKLAYQPCKSLMREYDIDWTMPYNEETGEVDDNEISIYPDTDLKGIIDELLKCYESYLV